MSKPLALPALAQFVAATAGRNMTKAAYVAVSAGVVLMVLLTVDPSEEAGHLWIESLLWACLAFFVFEWVVRLRHAFWRNAGWPTPSPAAGWSTPAAPSRFRSP